MKGFDGKNGARSVVIFLPADPSGSAEFDYLGRLVRHEVGKVFGSPLLVATSDEGGVCGDWVLAFRSERVLVLGRTLVALERALVEGADVAYPWSLAQVTPREPVLTLRGFERAEAGLLKPGDGQWEEVAVAPVALWRWEAWLGRGEAACGWKVAKVGLCHEFIDYYGEVRKDVVPFLPVGVREVLEIGCARGFTGAFLQETLGCRVTGVELNPVVAEEARARLYEVIVGDVEALELGRQFDAVLALELFEHLKDPFAFSQKVQGWLRPGGVMILSTPNVGHWSVVQDLLEGRWDYLPVGLLCFTHLRFFTRKSLEDLLRYGGWNDVRIVPQPGPMPAEVAKRLRRVGVYDEESLNTLGFWVVAKKG
ncbi:MAG: class I SAM-dependent methyltransferase [Thermoanaerobaculum sp.]